MQHTIRSYQEKDFDRIVDLVVVLQDYFKAIDTSDEVILFTSRKGAEEYMNKAIKDADTMNGRIFVCEIDGKPAGFIQGVIVNYENDQMHTLTHKKGSDGWIGLLVVEPHYRNKGVGKKLLNKMKNYFKKSNCLNMKLKVSSDNQSAISLYKRYGMLSEELAMAIKL